MRQRHFVGSIAAATTPLGRAPTSGEHGKQNGFRRSTVFRQPPAAAARMRRRDVHVVARRRDESDRAAEVIAAAPSAAAFGAHDRQRPPRSRVVADAVGRDDLHSVEAVRFDPRLKRQRLVHRERAVGRVANETGRHRVVRPKPKRRRPFRRRDVQRRRRRRLQRLGDVAAISPRHVPSVRGPQLRVEDVAGRRDAVEDGPPVRGVERVPENSVRVHRRVRLEDLLVPRLDVVSGHRVAIQPHLVDEAFVVEARARAEAEIGPRADDERPGRVASVARWLAVGFQYQLAIFVEREAAVDRPERVADVRPRLLAVDVKRHVVLLRRGGHDDDDVRPLARRDAARGRERLLARLRVRPFCGPKPDRVLDVVPAAPGARAVRAHEHDGPAPRAEPRDRLQAVRVRVRLDPRVEPVEVHRRRTLLRRRARRRRRRRRDAADLHVVVGVPGEFVAGGRGDDRVLVPVHLSALAEHDPLLALEPVVHGVPVRGVELVVHDEAIVHRMPHRDVHVVKVRDLSRRQRRGEDAHLVHAAAIPKTRRAQRPERAKVEPVVVSMHRRGRAAVQPHVRRAHVPRGGAVDVKSNEPVRDGDGDVVPRPADDAHRGRRRRRARVYVRAVLVRPEPDRVRDVIAAAPEPAAVAFVAHEEDAPSEVAHHRDDLRRRALRRLQPRLERQLVQSRVVKRRRARGVQKRVDAVEVQRRRPSRRVRRRVRTLARRGDELAVRRASRPPVARRREVRVAFDPTRRADRQRVRAVPDVAVERARGGVARQRVDVDAERLRRGDARVIGRVEEFGARVFDEDDSRVDLRKTLVATVDAVPQLDAGHVHDVAEVDHEPNEAGVRGEAGVTICGLGRGRVHDLRWTPRDVSVREFVSPVDIQPKMFVRAVRVARFTERDVDAVFVKHHQLRDVQRCRQRFPPRGARGEEHVPRESRERQVVVHALRRRDSRVDA
eukprot:16644-Pelagococcus_subviridis.AAC.5